MSDLDRAYDMVAAWFNEQGKALRGIDLNLLARHVEKVVGATREETVERVVSLIEGGHFLHDDAPAARFAREVVAAIRREIK